MSTLPGPLDMSPPFFPSDVVPRPSRSLAILAIVIFCAEMVSMAILYFLEMQNYLAETVLDGLIMVMLILPGLYFLQLKPVINQMESRDRAEKALRASESLFRKVLEALPIGVWISDEYGQIIHGNPASQQIWAGARYVGIEHYGEYKGWWADNGEPIEPQQWAIPRAISQGVPILNEEVEIEAFDGKRKIIVNSAIPIIDEHGAIQGAIAVNQDITQSRQAQKELVRTNELLERFFSSISTLIAYMDRDFNFIRVNDAYARSAGHLPEFFIGKNHFELYPHEENRAIFQRVVETGEPFSILEKPFEYAEYPERGVTYWDWGLQPVKTPDGAVEGLVLSLVDVTERKRAEIRVERQNVELSQMVQAESTARQFAETLSTAAQALTHTLDLEHVFNTLIEYLHGIIQSDTIGVNLFEDETRMAMRALRGFGDWMDEERIPTMPITSISDSLIHRLISDRRSQIIPDLNIPQLVEGYPEDRGMCNWLVVPIVASEKVIGLVEFGRASQEPFEIKQIKWAEALVSEAAMAIQNAWLFEQVRSSSERLKNLARKLVDIQETDRYTIARELHDEAGQALSSLKLSLRQLEHDPECPAHMRQRLQELKDVVDGVQEELHRLAMDLRPVALDRLGLVAALEQLSHSMNTEWLSIRFKAVGLGGELLPKDLEIALYRIVQEALTNVIHHAQASHIGILLELIDSKVKIFVEDDGIGFDVNLLSEIDRLGLVGMRERAEMFGGTLTVESSSGKGTAVIVEVPIGHSDSYRR